MVRSPRISAGPLDELPEGGQDPHARPAPGPDLADLAAVAATALASGAPIAAALTAAQALRLQRLVGNQAVVGLVRPPAPSSGPPSRIQRDYELDGRFGGIYESEQFGGEGSTRERPTYVELPVRITTTTGRGAAPPPLSQFLHGGKLDLENTVRKPGFDGGHIVGLQIGGEDIPENVVPMFKAFNRGVYKNAEDEIRQQSEKLRSQGKQPWITVHCYYGDNADDTPYAFDLILECTSPPSEDRSAVWATFLRQPEDIKVVAPLSEDAQKVVRGEVKPDEVASQAAAELEASAKFFNLHPYDSVSKYVAAKKNMPPTTNGMYPDNPSMRPYQYLDLLAFSRKLDVGTEMSAFREFTGRQRELILQANMARNGGAIKSDDPDDPVPGGVLSEMGDLNFPEIDHIVPKSSGGSNMFSNARVVSWRLNNQEDRVKSLVGIIDVTKRALPPLKGMGKNDIPTLVEQYVLRVGSDRIFSVSDVWLWGTENFGVMSGQKMTAGRQSLVKTSLLKYVAGKVLVEPSAGRYQKKA